jgi:cellulose synthase/poly-beta-1,6-N-acetylglucosamine synthase-like glycosyltransferase
MESILELDLSILFLVAVILIWFMIAWQLVLTMMGFRHHVRSLRERDACAKLDLEWPAVSILIPAHNEELVIDDTLAAMCALDYPADRLEIIVVNDGSSDATGRIVDEWSRRDPRVIPYTVPAGEGGRGKSRALNLGLGKARHPVIAVYDADNTPETSALRALVTQLVLHPELGAVLGKFRTINKRASLLTRFINIETLSYQNILQAGRWQLLGIATLPGTNFVIRREVLDAVGGWDEDAITEDSELSIRTYMAGWKIKYIPYAVTWEQEPETWRVWVRQRTRWVQGNNYVSKKFLRLRREIPSRRLRFEIAYSLALYYVFFVAIVVSDVLFVLGASRLVTLSLPGPYTLVWGLAIVLFFAEIFLTLSYDREDTPGALVLIASMYLVYCQLWMYVVARAFWLDVVRRETRHWEKTERVRINHSIPPTP